jgi:hypothetical protein
VSSGQRVIVHWAGEPELWVLLPLSMSLMMIRKWSRYRSNSNIEESSLYLPGNEYLFTERANLNCESCCRYQCRLLQMTNEYIIYINWECFRIFYTFVRQLGYVRQGGDNQVLSQCPSTSNSAEGTHVRQVNISWEPIWKASPIYISRDFFDIVNVHALCFKYLMSICHKSIGNPHENGVVMRGRSNVFAK